MKVTLQVMRLHMWPIMNEWPSSIAAYYSGSSIKQRVLSKPSETPGHVTAHVTYLDWSGDTPECSLKMSLSEHATFITVKYF